LPPAVALSLQPKVERAISLELSDILEQVPSGYVKPRETFDSSRRILLKASEIEKGMADGKPTVSLATIYEQVPEIFLHTLRRGETAHVPLPYEKVLEQFNKVQIRSDQVCEQAVPQVETPILQVTIEDKDRFGTTMEPTQTSAFPPVKVEPATAKTISSAEPEPAVSETVARATPTQRRIPLSTPVVATPKSPRPENPATAGPTRIPFQLPPNGMGASASERVPASSGPPIPTGVPKGPTSARIPFKISAPCDDLRPKLTLVPGVEAPEKVPAKPAQSSTPKKEQTKIGLSLQAIMQNMPAFQLNGNPETIPTEVRVEFPLSLIEPQLATGRVAIEAKTFQAAMPGNFREIFIVDSSETPVLLPLQEVLKNLPSAALKMRDDQEEIETGASFETPFLLKAKEDEERFRVSSAPVSKPSEKPATETAREETRPDATAPERTEEVKAKTTEAPKPVEASVPERAAEAARHDNAALEKAASISKQEAEASKEQNEAGLEPAPPHDIKGRKEKNEAKEVLARVNALPGVAGSCLTFADGLGLAGNLPAEAAADGLCAMAPSLLQRIERHMLDTKLGSLTAVTLHCTKSPVTFFMQGNICLTVLQAGAKLASETQDELVNMTKELSRTYSQPETAHVDH
jgi:predicted regulator of Ras-like GTPase activity (Roadblock/LC7/MglB family)